MNENDNVKFAEIMTGTAEVYGRDISELAMLIYWNALKNYPIDDVVLAFNRHITNPDNGQFMPKPADIVKCIDGSNETNSMLAWTKVMSAVSCVGPHHDVVFDDPIIHQVIDDMGGWIDLCSHTYHEMEFKLNEFNKRYIRYKNSPKEDYPKKLTGISNGHNSANNHRLKPPRLIGDQAQAELVYSGGIDNVKRIGTLGDNVLKLVERF